jgi:ketosteroid isomerase-like protein
MPEPTNPSAKDTLPEPGWIHRRLVELYLAAVDGDFAAALALIDPDVVDHRGGTSGDHVGRDAWRRKWERAAATDIQVASVTIEQNVSAGDVSANRYTLRGLHAPSGRRFEVMGLDMVRVRNGMVVEHWAVLDGEAMAAQLGRGINPAGPADTR